MPAPTCIILFRLRKKKKKKKAVYFFNVIEDLKFRNDVVNENEL